MLKKKLLIMEMIAGVKLLNIILFKFDADIKRNYQ